MQKHVELHLVNGGCNSLEFDIKSTLLTFIFFSLSTVAAAHIETLGLVIIHLKYCATHERVHIVVVVVVVDEKHKKYANAKITS
jgi:hypothetical protein